MLGMRVERGKRRNAKQSRKLRRRSANEKNRSLDVMTALELATEPMIVPQKIARKAHIQRTQKKGGKSPGKKHAEQDLSGAPTLEVATESMAGPQKERGEDTLSGMADRKLGPEPKAGPQDLDEARGEDIRISRWRRRQQQTRPTIKASLLQPCGA
jgi:hypothetical protein